MHHYPKIVLLALLLINASIAFAWETLTNNLAMKCAQEDISILSCDYRLLMPEPPLEIYADSADQSLSIIENTSYPWYQGVTAILFLVDTSDPARQVVIDNNIKHIEILLRASDSHHKIGLASFDKKLQIEAPIGASESLIIKASQSLRAIGKTTELYRSMIKAVAVLDNISADRKAIYLFSDGQAEDKAYYHQDVIKAARNANVIINSLGYPRSIRLSVALQTLRRLSEETGGIYVEADNNFNLPNSFLEFPFDNIDRGGRIIVDLTPAMETINRNADSVSLTFETDIGDFTTHIPVTFPVTTSETRIDFSTSESKILIQAPKSRQTPEIKLITSAPETQDINLWLWYGLPIALTILIVLMIITLVVIFQQKGVIGTSKSSNTITYKPFAYLITQEIDTKRYPITNPTWRIGRSKDNELTLNDNSVSRRHAEIHRYSNGSFIIFDVDSLNGVYVNEEKIKKKKLQENDIVEIGDIILRFSLYSSDFQSDGDTAIQKTKTPV